MVSPVTVRGWAQKGLLQALTTPGGHRRFLREEVMRFANTSASQFRTRPSRQLKVMVASRDGELASRLRGLPPDPTRRAVAVTEVDSAFDAGFFILSAKPDVFLLDMGLPGLAGLDVCRRLRHDSATAAIRVVAVVDSSSPTAARDLIEAGAAECLVKPYTTEALLTAVGLV